MPAAIESCIVSAGVINYQSISWCVDVRRREVSSDRRGVGPKELRVGSSVNHSFVLPFIPPTIHNAKGELWTILASSAITCPVYVSSECQSSLSNFSMRGSFTKRFPNSSITKGMGLWGGSYIGVSVLSMSRKKNSFSRKRSSWEARWWF